MEATLSIAKDERVLQDFPDVRILNEGRSFVFRDDEGVDMREYDGILVSPAKNAVLMLSAKLGATSEDVSEALDAQLVLEDILCGDRPVSNFPEELESFHDAQARVL